MTPNDIAVEFQTNFLTKAFGHPGLLQGLDLISGVRYERVVPHDPSAFFRAHVLGPARCEAPTVEVLVGNDIETRATFIRPTIMPVADLGVCGSLAVVFRTTNSLVPCENVVAAIRAVQRADFRSVLERSVLTGVWIIWILLDEAKDCDNAMSIARRVHRIIANVGLSENEFDLPLLSGDRVSLHVPWAFYGGGFWGVLFELADDGRHVVLGPPDDDRSDAATGSVGDVARIPRACEMWSPFLEAWHAEHGARRVRAGRLADLALSRGVLPSDLLASVDGRQSTAIVLGRALLRFSEVGIEGWSLTATPSGNSTAFSLVRVEDGIKPPRR